MSDIAGNNTAWHFNPVWDSDGTVQIDLASYQQPGRFEQLCVKTVLDRLVEVRCIPFFTHGISLGDLLRIDAQRGFMNVKAKGDYNTLRIAIAAADDLDDARELLQEWVANSGLLHEWHGRSYVALAYPAATATSGSQWPNLDALERYAELFSVQFDEAAPR